MQIKVFKCWTISQHRPIEQVAGKSLCLLGESSVNSEPISRSQVPAWFNLAYYRSSGTFQTVSKMVVKTKTMESKVGFKTVGIGASVRTTLVNALAEGRTVIGMANAIRRLREDPQQFVFCFMAPSSVEQDSGSHMQQVLLEAFCFEHDIYIIKVDSAEKLSRLVQSNELAWCALVQKGPKKETRSENILIDHCELYWDEPLKPVIKLPEK